MSNISLNNNLSQVNPAVAEKKKGKKLFSTVFANQRVIKLIQFLDRFFIKLPHLPKKVNSFISKIIPYLVLLVAIIGAIASLLSGAFLALSLIALDWQLILETGGSFLLVLINTLLLIKAFKPLRQGNAIGWIYLFWTHLFNLVYSTVSMINGELNVWSGSLSLIIFTYLLFEIGPFYTYRGE